jgi:hypothetical protein
MQIIKSSYIEAMGYSGRGRKGKGWWSSQSGVLGPEDL